MLPDASVLAATFFVLNLVAELQLLKKSSPPALAFTTTTMPGPIQLPKKGAKPQQKKQTKTLKRKRDEDSLQALERRVQEYVCPPIPPPS